MSWKALTATDLKSALNSQELELFSRHGSDYDMTDRAPKIIAQVVAQIRGEIASHSLNMMSKDECLIPVAYHANALAIARYRLLSTLPYMEVSSSREKEYDEANTFFESVAAGRRRPEPASDARSNTAAKAKNSSGAQVVTHRTKITGRNNLAGL